MPERAPESGTLVVEPGPQPEGKPAESDEIEALTVWSEGQEQTDRDADQAAISLVQLYLDSIARHPLLSAGQEIELARRIESGLFAGRLLLVTDPALSGGERQGHRDSWVWAYAKAQKNQGKKTDTAPMPTELAAAQLLVDAAIDRFGDELRHPPSRQDFIELAQEGEDAWRQMVESNLRLVVKFAKRYPPNRLSLLDIIQEGNIGLMHAVAKFDHMLGYRFSTSAINWIRRYISDAVADQSFTIRLPVKIVTRVNAMERKRREFFALYGRDITPEELAQSMGQPLGKIQHLTEISHRPISLDLPIGREKKDGGVTIADLVVDTSTDPARIVEAMLEPAILEQTLLTLSEDERRVLRLRFGLDDGEFRTFVEIGNTCRVSDFVARTIYNRALRKLRQPDSIALLQGEEAPPPK